MEVESLWSYTHCQHDIESTPCTLQEFLLKQTRATQETPIEGFSSTRAHFSVSGDFLELLANQWNNLQTTRSNFVDTVFDTKQYTYLRNGQWLILRIVDKGEDEPSELIWKLRQVERRESTLYWKEVCNQITTNDTLY